MRAAFCVPIIIDANKAFDVSKRPTPEMAEAGKEPGTNLAGNLLNEPNRPTRCCVVLRVSGNGVAWMQKKSEAYGNHQQSWWVGKVEVSS